MTPVQTFNEDHARAGMEPTANTGPATRIASTGRFLPLPDRCWHLPRHARGRRRLMSVAGAAPRPSNSRALSALPGALSESMSRCQCSRSRLSGCARPPTRPVSPVTPRRCRWASRRRSDRFAFRRDVLRRSGGRVCEPAHGTGWRWTPSFRLLVSGRRKPLAPDSAACGL
jgi:hypothetical protein